MVHYELAVIFRTLAKPQLSTAIRSACTALLEQGSIVRGMENRGERRLPYKMGAHKERFTHGSVWYPIWVQVHTGKGLGPRYIYVGNTSVIGGRGKLCVLNQHNFRYFIFDLDAPANSVKLIVSKIRNNKDVIRANVVKTDTP